MTRADGTQVWQIDGPRVLDVGDENERVSKLEVGVVGGRVDVVTHDDSPTARVEVTHVEGLPVRVTWDGATLRLIHGKDSDKNIVDMVKKTLESFGRNKVAVSISVPVDTRATVSSVSATAVVSGLHSRVRVNTVSGALTVSDLHGDIDLNTVSGNVEGEDLVGATSINTVSGSVTVQGSQLPEVKVNTVSGDIALDLTSGRARIRSNSVSGDVTVRAPLQGFDVDGNTASGQVIVDGRKLSRGGGRPGSPDRGGHLHYGDGALQIKANAVSGSIVVLRSPSGEAPADSGGAPADSATVAGDRSGYPSGQPQDAPAGTHPADPPPDDQAERAAEEAGSDHERRDGSSR